MFGNVWRLQCAGRVLAVKSPPPGCRRPIDPPVRSVHRSSPGGLAAERQCSQRGSSAETQLLSLGRSWRDSVRLSAEGYAASSILRSLMPGGPAAKRRVFRHHPIRGTLTGITWPTAHRWRQRQEYGSLKDPGLALRMNTAAIIHSRHEAHTHPAGQQTLLSHPPVT